MKVHVRCRCGPSNEISIVVTDQRKGLTSETLRRRPDVGARWQRGHGTQLMKAFTDEHTLNAAARKSLCASERDISPFREAGGRVSVRN